MYIHKASFTSLIAPQRVVYTEYRRANLPNTVVDEASLQCIDTVHKHRLLCEKMHGTLLKARRKYLRRPLPARWFVPINLYAVTGLIYLRHKRLKRPGATLHF